MLSRQSGPHPASMQSLVSSGRCSQSSRGVSNPCRLTPDEVYCGLTEPLEPTEVDARTRHQQRQQQHCCRGGRRHQGCRNLDRHWRHVGRACARAKRVGCLRSALLAAFVLILVGVIVTSSYAIDRRFSQLPQLLYAGLCLCSIGLFVIVVAVTMLVTRQLGKHQLHQEHQQHHQQQLHLTTSGISATGPSRRSGAPSRVPIWYIGCHRDTATAYCPPVPPSYWDSSAAGSRSSHQQQQQQPLPPRPQSRASTAATTAGGSSTPPPPPLPPSRQSRLPPLPQPPPTYQEALRCLEETSSSAASGSGRRRQPIGGAGSCDQLSVLKWTVKHHHHQQQQQQRQQQHQLAAVGNYRPAAAAQLRRCESSSFIGEPILV